MKQSEQHNQYVIKTENIEVRAIRYGACITMIKVSDRNGKKANVLASFQDVKDYVQQPDPYLNAMVGPVAGRIAYGAYTLGQTKKQLSITNGLHHLHGGKSGISKQSFHVEKICEGVVQKLRFTLDTKHDCDGFCGMFHYEIEYIVEGNILTIKARCRPEKATILNMTSHLYFNLSGDLRTSIAHHLLEIPAKKKVGIHKDGHPYGILPIKKGTAFDFTKKIEIGKAYALGDAEFSITKGYDTAFLLDGNIIRLEDEASGRVLTIKTNQESVVMYTANYFNDALVLNQGKKGFPFCCLALETQAVPNGVNLDQMETKQYDMDHPYEQTTQYTFSILL